MRSVWRALIVTTAVVSLSLVQAATVARPPSGDRLTPQERHGREVWFTSTFGGEKFFSLILPEPPFQLPLGFDQLLTQPSSKFPLRIWLVKPTLSGHHSSATWQTLPFSH